MIKRNRGVLAYLDPAQAPEASRALEAQGYAVLPEVFSVSELKRLSEEITAVFSDTARDNRSGDYRPDDEDEMFRYEMLNKSQAVQEAIAHPGILSVIEPLLGDDCHVIANTAWRNTAHHEATHGGQRWHIDAGPHIPLPDGASWPSDIPHPVFAIGVHIFLQDCSLEDGPTGVIPNSHYSGRFPPLDRLMDADLEYEGNQVVPLVARAGDVALFVSDVWHRRMPAGEHDRGRFFLQVHYGRRDIAQRLKTTAQANQLSDEAIARATSKREQTLIGLHPVGFYDG